jgi:hypothetical protein
MIRRGRSTGGTVEHGRLFLAGRSILIEPSFGPRLAQAPGPGAREYDRVACMESRLQFAKSPRRR